MDSIVYNGDIEELQNIKNGYTKVILHSVASPRNDADFLISAREIVIDKEMNEFDDYNGSLFGANPVFLQEEKLELASYQFCMQIYGGDFPEKFQDIGLRPSFPPFCRSQHCRKRHILLNLLLHAV